MLVGKGNERSCESFKVATRGRRLCNWWGEWREDGCDCRRGEQLSVTWPGPVDAPASPFVYALYAARRASALPRPLSPPCTAPDHARPDCPVSRASAAAAAACEAPPASCTPWRSRWPGNGPMLGAQSTADRSTQLHSRLRELPLARMQLASLTHLRTGHSHAWFFAIGAPSCSRR